MKIQLFIPGLENQGKNEDLKECFPVPAVRSISSRQSGIKSKARRIRLPFTSASRARMSGEVSPNEGMGWSLGGGRKLFEDSYS